jgi:phage tail sheath gpL-like
MSQEIAVTGLAQSDVVPGIYPEVIFGAGASAAGSSFYNALIIANKTSAGSASTATVYGPDTATSFTTREEAVGLFGDGSEAMRMVDRFWATNKSTPLYVLLSAQVGSVGDGYITFTTTAAANGSARIFIGTTQLEASIVTGDTPAVIAQSVVNAINGKPSLPVTASVVGNAAYLVSKNTGIRANSIRYMAAVIGSGVATTVTPLTDTAFTHGATVDDVTAALAAILATRFYYVIPAHEDSVNLGLIKTQVLTQAQPLTNIRQRVVCGSVDTIANTITLANALNDARVEVCWHKVSDCTPGEIAAQCAAVFSLEEQKLFGSPGTAQNFDSYGVGAQNAANWHIPADRSSTQTARSVQVSALNSGISPIINQKGGVTMLVSRITSKSLTNSQPDFRVRDGNIPTVCDRFTDDLVGRFAARFANKLLGPDLAAGASSPDEMVTPRILKATIASLVTEYVGAGLLLDSAGINAATVVSLSAVRGRVGCKVPLQTVPVLHQIAALIQQVA